jgi:hypothetical protein
MVLTEYCSDIAQRLGLKTICAVTTRSNSRMISLLAKSGFEVQHDGEGGVLGRKTLAGELRTSPSVEESLWYSV